MNVNWIELDINNSATWPPLGDEVLAFGAPRYVILRFTLWQGVDRPAVWINDEVWNFVPAMSWCVLPAPPEVDR